MTKTQARRVSRADRFAKWAHSIGLTPALAEVLPMVIQGMSDKEIAGTLAVTEQAAAQRVATISKMINTEKETE